MTLSRPHENTKINFSYVKKKNDWKEMYQNVIIVLSQRNRTFFFSLPFGFLCFSNFYKEHILLLQSEEFILDFKEIRNV